MRYVLGLLLCAACAWGLNASEKSWQNGQTFLGFLEANKIPHSLYYNLAAEDKELATEVMAGTKYHLLTDDSGALVQALIPIGEDNQIHLYQDSKSPSGYGFSTIPVRYFEKRQSIAFELSSVPYNEIIHITGDSRLASEFAVAFRSSIGATSLYPQDKLALIYNRKYRLGKPYGAPEIIAGVIEARGKPHYLFSYKDGGYYNEKGESLMQFLFTVPLRYTRISSSFSNARKHPILGYKRPHLGVDYAAPRGTPVHAAGSGTVSFVGYKGGYGKTIIITHGDGFKTLYGHLDGYARGIRTGKKVAQGTRIGYVGNTGLSTGPHLHLGLYKNGKAINPQKNVQRKKKKLAASEFAEFSAQTDPYKAELQATLSQENLPIYEKPQEYIAARESAENRAP